MKIWIVNPFDNLPVEGFRPQRYWLMAEAFAGAGHDVVLWTQNWSHAKKARRPETPSGAPLELRYVPVPGYSRKISLRRIFSHWRFAENWRKAADAAEEKPDLVVVSSPPLFIGREVRGFCKRNNAKCIVDIMDAWPETFERVVPKWCLKPLARTAKENYLGADGITAVAKRYLEMAKAYGAKSPMHLCHHGIKATPGANETGQREVSETLKLVYIGNMSLSYDLATVVDAVKKGEKLSLDLAGAGPDEASLRKRAGECGRIRFHGYLDSDGVKELLFRADAGVVPMFGESCVGVPYKLADYAAAKLPVLNSLEGETKDMFEETGAGVFYEAGNVDSFVSATEKLRDGRSAMSENAEKLFGKFDAAKIYPSYVAFAEGIASAPRKKETEEKRPAEKLWPWAVAAFAVLYAASAQRGLSWGDPGLFQFRILSHDIEGLGGLALAHPLYVMAGNVFSRFLPENVLLWGLNFFSGIWMALALAVLRKTVYEATDSAKAALLAVLTLGFSHMAWFSSTMSETYTMSLFFIALETLSLVKFLKTGNWGYVVPLAFFNGLGISVHNFSLLALPVYVCAIAAKSFRPSGGERKAKVAGMIALSFFVWLAGLSPILVLAAKSYLASHDFIAVLKSFLFGGYEGAVTGMRGIDEKSLVSNLLLASLSFMLPGWFFFFGKPSPQNVSSIRKALWGLFAIHFVFWARYFVPDQATFLLPTLFFGVLLSSTSMDKVKRVKLFAVSTALLAVAVPVAATFAARNVFGDGGRKALPFRDDIEYFIEPWKANERSADSFAFKVSMEASGSSTVYADISAMAPLACAKKLGWLPRGLRLHDPYFNGGDISPRRGERYFEVRPFLPYRKTPADWMVEKPAEGDILYRCTPKKRD